MTRTEHTLPPGTRRVLSRVIMLPRGRVFSCDMVSLAGYSPREIEEALAMLCEAGHIVENNGQWMRL